MSQRSNGFERDGRRVGARVFDWLEDAVGEVRTQAMRRWPKAFGYGPNWQPTAGPQRGAAAGIVNAARARRAPTEPEKWLEGWNDAVKLAVDTLREIEKARCAEADDLAEQQGGTVIALTSADHLEDRLRDARARVVGILGRP